MNREELPVLAADYLADRLSPEKQDELSRLLAEDAELADEFWQQVSMHGLLHARAGKLPERADLWERIEGAIEDAPSSTSFPRVRPRAWRRPARTESSRTPLFIAAAVLLAAGLALVLLLPNEAPVVRPPEAPPAARKPVELPRPIVRPVPETPEPPAVTRIPTPAGGRRKDDPEAPAPKAPPAIKREVRAPLKPPAPKPTIPTIARIDQLEGEVTLVTPDGREPAQVGKALRPGTGIETGEKEGTVVSFPDGTKIALAAGTRLREITDGEAGKRVFVAAGKVAAEVARQAAKQPMVFHTPHGEARVVGTQLTLEVSADSTRLDVTEGRVRLTRRPDGNSVLVRAGYYAIAGAGVRPSAKPIASLRVRNGLLALYRFDEGKGGVIRDVSGAGAPLHIQVSSGKTAWTRTGLEILEPSRLVSVGPAAKITDACRRTNEITVEAWITPRAGFLNEPGRLVTLSPDAYNRSFTLAQGEAKRTVFALRLRTTQTQGLPALTTPDNSAEARRVHVVATRNASGETVLYLDGVERARGIATGDLSNWDAGYRLILANEAARDLEGNERPWLGQFHLVALYQRALPAAEVVRNFRAGPGR